MLLDCMYNFLVKITTIERYYKMTVQYIYPPSLASTEDMRNIDIYLMQNIQHGSCLLVLTKSVGKERADFYAINYS